ncbi:MAG: maleylacetoacetate isomerase [Thalassotalea sp.]|nr:maleylacetoacetate isomerase [Thalassotalea sp.]
MKLYGYWRSSAAYRVRIALHLKQIAFESIPVHLIKDGGEQHSSAYDELNPAHLVPTLVDEEFTLHQSLAIIDYLEHKCSSPSVYPSTPQERAIVSALAFDIACEIHPINNLRVQQYLVNELSASGEQKSAWVNDWISKGFSAFERQLQKYAGEFCFSNTVTLADICLVPQVYNAKRFNVDMSPYPLIQGVTNRCNELDAFIAALPENQEDAL